MNKFEPFIDRRCNLAIETGTFFGQTTRVLSCLPNFQVIYTIELDNNLYEQAKKNFYGSLGRVFLLQGDSTEQLPVALSRIVKNRDPRIMVLLDAHYSGGVTARGSVATPLRAELNALIPYSHAIGQVLIDDIAVSLGEGGKNPIYEEAWPDIDEVKELLMQINPAFQVTIHREVGDLGLLEATLNE